MKRPDTTHTAARAPFQRTLMVVMAALMLLAALASPAMAQDTTEPQPTEDPAQLVPSDPTAPQGDDEEETTEPAPTPEPTQEAAETTPEAEDEGEDEGQDNQQEGGAQVTSTVQRADAAAGPGFPAVLAHGLAYVTGDDVVWQVREVVVPDAGDASSTTSNAAALIQRQGSTIVRNDVTGKRAKMDVGEGYFRAAADGYTLIAEDDDSLLWQFELVDPDDVELDAFYEGPVIEDLDEAVYDMSMTRYVLGGNERVELPANSGAGLVMVLSGEAEVAIGDNRSVLGEGDGQTVGDDAITVSQTGSGDAVFVYVYLGDEVADDTAGTADTSQASTEEPATEGDEETDETLQDEAEVEDAADTAASAETGTTDDAGNFITSIDVTADAEIYLVITVDGLTVFDGILPAGASSGPVVGTVFEVYTSSGVNTNFTNACGDYFKMGFEEGEANYVLEATAESCAP